MRFVTKDNQTYIFDSKYEFLNNPYAINNAIKKSIDKKINDNMEFLQNSYVEINGKKMLSLYDLTITANYQPKVFKAELWNRIETMRQLAKELKFDTPVFITLTPPSELKPLKQIKLKKYISLDTYGNYP